MNVVDAGGSSIDLEQQRRSLGSEQVELLEDHAPSSHLRRGASDAVVDDLFRLVGRDRGADAAHLAHVRVLPSENELGVSLPASSEPVISRAAKARAACSFVDPAGPTNR